MREAVNRLGGDVAKVNPLSPVDLVIDHSVTVDHFGVNLGVVLTAVDRLGNTIEQARQRTRVMGRKLREVEAVEAEGIEFEEPIAALGVGVE